MDIQREDVVIFIDVIICRNNLTTCFGSLAGENIPDDGSLDRWPGSGEEGQPAGSLLRQVIEWTRPIQILLSI